MKTKFYKNHTCIFPIREKYPLYSLSLCLYCHKTDMHCVHLNEKISPHTYTYIALFITILSYIIIYFICLRLYFPYWKKKP